MNESHHLALWGTRPDGCWFGFLITDYSLNSICTRCTNHFVTLSVKWTKATICDMKMLEACPETAGRWWRNKADHLETYSVFGKFVVISMK